MSVVTVDEVTQGRVVVASPHLQFASVSCNINTSPCIPASHTALDCDAHLSCISHLTNCLHPSHFISQLSDAAPPPLDSSSAGHRRTCTNIMNMYQHYISDEILLVIISYPVNDSWSQRP